MARSDDIDRGPAASPPFAFGGDALVWAAWLYYAESHTQADVAKALGVSRASVANYLAEARRRGLVKIEIAPDLLARVAVSRALADRFGLAEALVAPAAAEGEDPAALRRRLGAAAAHALAPRLGPDMTLGVAWGRTMLALARALPERALPTLRVAQVSGSSLGDAESAPEACTALIAGRLGARCQNFHAPAVLTSKAVRDALAREPSVSRHLARLRACDLVVLGIGEVNREVTFAESEFVPEGVTDAYLARGAVGIVIGRFIDAEGREVDGPLSGRRIGMTLADLAAVPVRLAVAGGREKIAAIRAALAGGLATHLVTDARTARRLLEDGA
jgi:DNA-binding transcriptional regulator LsrR (DeoR family)